MEKPSLTVIIPAYNEAESLSRNLENVLAYCQERGWELIIVNDGSKDGTRQMLERYADRPNLSTYHHKVNRGYGGALKTGLLNTGTEYAVTIDADGQHRLEDIDVLYKAALETDADLVIGSRPAPEKPDFERSYRELGKWLIRSITSLLMPLPIRDLNSGFKLYNTALVQQYLHLCPNSMAFSDIISLAFINQHHLVIEHPIQIQERTCGKSTINTYTAIETMIEIFNIVMLFNPLRIFLPAAIFFLVAGFLWGLPILLAGRGFSAATVLAIMTGIIFLFLGLLAEQLSQIRKQNILNKKDKDGS